MPTAGSAKLQAQDIAFFGEWRAAQIVSVAIIECVK
jgi:hypothetical protein